MSGSHQVTEGSAHPGLEQSARMYNGTLSRSLSTTSPLGFLITVTNWAWKVVISTGLCICPSCCDLDCQQVLDLDYQHCGTPSLGVVVALGTLHLHLKEPIKAPRCCP